MSLSAHPSHPTCRVSRCARVRSSKLKLPTRPVHGAPYSARPNHAMLCNISWHGPPKNAVTAATHRHPLPRRSTCPPVSGLQTTASQHYYGVPGRHCSHWTESVEVSCDSDWEGGEARTTLEFMQAWPENSLLRPPSNPQPFRESTLPHGAVHHTPCHRPTRSVGM